METQCKNLLLTGPPGCGKTTVICGLIERLGDLRLRLRQRNRLQSSSKGQMMDGGVGASVGCW
jgi:DNA replication protein DnaC